ncbi:SDR family NAD(P)-dependent oxidoreductase [Alteromonas oceanisediminis]|uniref:SDR family NAD(P)-dependent oxidoreductase n=1 Tax=Alteromonas oceanisediminis TaxID=2836180 RepID=UPI001BDAF2FA|nr:SDR family NAD(P)-dependent oxidoreductase [Alteromonas oceanisediminis]MBT0585831.1 SDR family NAD(P)-dependent oxidoreductase [Alteromonas oceanisediminis]
MLITGATSGIGEALCQLASQRGYRVIACGRNQEKLDSLSTLDNVDTIRFDVTDEEGTRAALANVQCDIAVLNAGTCEYVDIDAIEPDMFHRVFAPNFFGVVNCVAALRKQLMPGDQLVIIDSMARLLPFTRSQAYGASKAALHYFTKSLDVDLAKDDIIVQAVAPGFVETPLTDKNDFDMPMKIPVDEAAQDLLKGIEKKSRNVYFPTLFGFILRTLNLLPSAAQRHLCVKMKKSMKREN